MKSIFGILAALVCSVALAARSAPAPASRPVSLRVDPVLQAATQAKLTPELEDFYAGLRPSAQRWAQDWRAYMATSQPTKPVDSNMEFLAVVSPNTELTRYLNFWNRTRNAARTTRLHYANNAFDKVDFMPPDGQAYVICRDDGRHWLVRFHVQRPSRAATKAAATQPGKLVIPRWDSGDLADFAGAARLGAAVALIHDAFELARQGKPLDSLGAGGPLAWPWPRPDRWVLYEQKWEKGALGFFPLEDALADNGKTGTRFGIQFRDAEKKDYGLNFSLVRDVRKEGYLGWRIEKMEPTDKPESERGK
jgi:hypothetical protein